MVTVKKRINISVSNELGEALQYLAKRDNQPQATKAVELLKLAIQIDEDDMLNKLAESRDKKDAKFINHKDAWK